ncbi:MAG: hypothetical protein R6U37_07015 [Dehalococcoidia bacterium]
MVAMAGSPRRISSMLGYHPIAPRSLIAGRLYPLRPRSPPVHAPEAKLCMFLSVVSPFPFQHRVVFFAAFHFLLQLVAFNFPLYPLFCEGICFFGNIGNREAKIALEVFGNNTIFSWEHWEQDWEQIGNNSIL